MLHSPKDRRVLSKFGLYRTGKGALGLLLGKILLTFTTEVLPTGVDTADPFFVELSAIPTLPEAARLPSRDNPNSRTLSKWSTIVFEALLDGSNSSVELLPASYIVGVKIQYVEVVR